MLIVIKRSSSIGEYIMKMMTTTKRGAVLVSKPGRRTDKLLVIFVVGACLYTYIQAHASSSFLPVTPGGGGGMDTLNDPSCQCKYHSHAPLQTHLH